jgi:hypothetical protein
MFKTWLKNKVLGVEWRKDETRQDREYIVAGPTNMREHEVIDDMQLFH